MLGVLFCVLGAALLTEGSDVGASGYGAVVDAGSSGTRVHIYKWNPDEWTQNSLPDIALVANEKIKPSLGSFSDNLPGVRANVREILARINAVVPEGSRSDTPLLFMATAGLRLLTESNSLAITEEVERVLEDASVNPYWHDSSSVRILSGEGEGAFSWLSANYLNNFFSDEGSSTGVLEMGGASSQITFLPEVDPLADKFPVQVLGHDYGLYTHSYLGYGQQALFDWILKTIAERNPGEDLLVAPCILKGDFAEVKGPNGEDVAFIGTGDPEECDKLVEEYFGREQEGSCNPKPCGLGAVYQPSSPENMKFFGISLYLYVLKGMGIFGDVEEKMIKPITYREEGLKYCTRDYDDVHAEIGDNPYISMCCPASLMLHKVLTRGLGLDDNATNLHVVESVNGTDISWTLGALIYELEKMKCRNGIPKSKIIQALEQIIQELENGR